MIFKTFNSGKGTFSSQFGVLGKSFEDIGSRFKKMSDELISTNDYTISNIVNAWKNSSIKKDLSDKFIITQEDIQDKFIDLSIYDNFNENKASSILKNLQTTNEQVEANATTWDAYLQGFKDQPEMQWQKDFIQTMDIQKATTEDVIKAQNTARESAVAYNNSLQQMTIGAKAANIAMKALAMVGNMVAMYAITKLITAYDDYKKKIHEVAEEASEQAEKSAEYVDKLADLQKELSDGTKSSDELTSAFKEQLKTMGYTSSEIDNLIEKYNGLSGAISEATREALDNAQTDAYVDVASSSKALTLDAYGGLTKDIFIQSVSTGNTDLDKEISKMLSSVASKSADQGKAWISKDNSAEGLYEYYNVLKDISQLIQQTAKETDNDDLLNLGSMFNTTMYGEITEAIDKLKDSAEEYGEAISRLNSIDAQIELADYLKTNDINTQEAFDTYISGIQNSTDYSETYKKVLIDVANNAFPQFVNAVKNADTALSGLSDETQNLSFTEAISNVQELSKGFDQLDKIYADVLNKEDFDWSSILNNTSFTEAFGECTDAYDEFIKTVANSPDDIDACQEAFNNLASAYIENKGILNDLTEENKQATITMLEQMGVANAEEVVTATLAHNKEELTLQNILLANSTMDLSTVTADEIQRLLDEGVITQEVAKQLAAYAAEKQYTNNKVINTVADCNNLIAMMKTAEGTTEAVAKLEKLKARLYNDNGTAKVISNEERKNVERAINNIAAEFNAKVSETIKIPQMTYNGGSSTQKVRDDLSKAAESAADSAKKTAEDLYNDLKEQIDAYMDYMEKSLDAGKIDYNTYCNSVRNYLDDLYHSGKLKAEDYFSYIEKMLNKQKAIFDKVISAVVYRIEKEVDAIQKQIDAIEKQNDALNEQKDNYDKILSVVSDVYDKQIEELNNQKQALQDQIDALNDTTDALDLQYRKEQALYALENAQRARNKKIYIEGKGYVYTQDYEDIKSKQKDLSDIKNEEIIDKLKKEQDAIDDSIEILNKYKELWADISKAYEEETNKQLAIAILGENYEKVILQNRMSDITNFKNKYVAVQKQIDDNTNLINSYNEKVDYYNKLKEQWQSITDEYDKQRNAQYASQVLGANWENDVLNGRLSTLDNFRNQYVSLQQAISDAQVQSANAQIKALQALADAAQASANAQVEAAKRAREATTTDDTYHSIGDAVNIDGMISAGAPTSVINKITGNKSNTSAAATADQRKNNSNIIMSNEQKMTIAASKSSFTNSDADKRKLFHNIRRYAGGGVVHVSPNNVFMKDIASQIGEDTLVAVRDGERVLTPVQNKWWERLTEEIPSMFNLLDNIPRDAFTGMNDMVRNLSENNISKSVSNSSVIVNIGDIKLEGIQNVDQFSNEIVNRLPSVITQKINSMMR